MNQRLVSPAQARYRMRFSVHSVPDFASKTPFRLNQPWFAKALSFVAVFSLLFTSVAPVGAIEADPILPQAQSVVAPPVTDDEIIVRPANLTTAPGWWYFYNDVTSVPFVPSVLAGDYEMVNGPSTPPRGDGSAQMSVIGTERYGLATYQYAGTDLDDIGEVAFSTYQTSTNPGATDRAIFLNLDIDFNNTTTTGYQGRLVFVPKDNGSVGQDSWQEWNGTSGMWRWSRFVSNGNQWLDGNTTELRSWADIITAFPNAELFNEAFPGQILLRAGEPYEDGFTGNTDKFVFAIPFHKFTYNFEPDCPTPTLPPSSADNTQLNSNNDQHPPFGCEKPKKRDVEIKKVWEGYHNGEGPSNKGDITITVESDLDDEECQYNEKGELNCTIRFTEGTTINIEETGLPVGWMVDPTSVGDVTPVCENVREAVLDDHGNPILDDNGEMDYDNSRKCTATIYNKLKIPEVCGTELVVNGGFELPEVTNQQNWDVFPSGSTGMGWSVDWVRTGGHEPDPANMELHERVNGWNPNSGSQHTELDSDWGGPTDPQSGEDASVVLYQDLITKIGSKYTVRLWTSPRPSQGTAENKTEVKLGGTVLDTIVEDGSTFPSTVWTEHVYTFTATSGVSRLEITDRGNGNSLGGFVDDVSVKEDCISEVTICKYDNNQNPLSGWEVFLNEPENTDNAQNVSRNYKGVTGENGCVILQDVPYGTYILDETMQDGWSNVRGKGDTVLVDEPAEPGHDQNDSFVLVNECDSDQCARPVPQLHFIKVVCNSYGDVLGNEDADSFDDTGNNYPLFSNYSGGTFLPSPLVDGLVNPSEIPGEESGCVRADGWSFKLSSNIDETTDVQTVGPTTSGEFTTPISGSGSVLSTALQDGILGQNDKQFWVSEVTQEGYDFAAIRCYNDALNGDNLEFINIGDDNPYHIYCIAYNVSLEKPCITQEVSIVSGTATRFEGLLEGSVPTSLNDEAFYPNGVDGFAVGADSTGFPGAWAPPLSNPNIIGSGAIWVNNLADQPNDPADAGGNGAVESWRLFSHTFTVPSDATNISLNPATLYFTADNEVTVFLNDVQIGSNTNFASVASSTPITLTPGSTYTLEFAVKNLAFQGPDNPTGLLYNLSFDYCGSPVEIPEDHSIAGKVYHDANINNNKDAEELGLASWTVKLFNYDEETNTAGSELDSEVTDAIGDYLFEGVDSGCYIVREVPQSGWAQTEPNNLPNHEYLVALGNADCEFEASLVDEILNLFVNSADAATDNAIGLDFGNYPTDQGGCTSNCGGGGNSRSSGSSSNNNDTPTPPGLVLGDTTTTPSNPQVLGASTLPRTGTPVMTVIALLAVLGVAGVMGFRILTPKKV